MFSLDLVELEMLIAQMDTEAIPAKIKQVETAFKKEQFLSEKPRLLRLKTHGLLACNRLAQCRKALQTGLKECQRQHNRVEEKILLELSKQIDQK